MTTPPKIFLVVTAIILSVVVFYMAATKTAVAPVPENPEVITDNVRVETPRQNDEIISPLVVKGEARGTWYFEASFPVRLLDGNGKELVVKPAQAKGDWMTTEFVPFEAELIFETPSTETGTLILEKDNPSGLPEYAADVRIPVRFKTTKAVTSGIRATVTIGPVCPVMRDPPDPACADKPYKADFKITKKGSFFTKTVSSGDDGIFSIELPPGEYTISFVQKNVMPRMSPVDFIVRKGEVTTLNLQFDSGIR